MKVKKLVLDTATFVKSVPIWDYGEEFYSMEAVVEEIRDKAAREYVQALPVPIKMREPHPESIRFISEFSKKVGDFSSLSLVDIKVLALTYELEVETKGSGDHLRKEPQQAVTQVFTARKVKDAKANIEGFYVPKSSEKMEEAENVLAADDKSSAGELIEDKQLGIDMEEDKKLNEVNQDELNSEDCVENCDTSEHIDNSENGESREELDSADSEDEQCEEDEDDDDDDDEGWITPSNIKKLKETSRENEEEEDVLVACMTADFAMQNVLKQIGLSVLGVDGKVIRHCKTYILRCHACFKTTSDMNKVFCPRCGHKALKKVAVTLNPDGSQKIWISNRPISTKGMKFSLPTPKGGQHALNPVLVADQREAQKMASKLGRKKTDPLSEDYDPSLSPFAMRDVYSKAAQMGYRAGKNHTLKYWEQRNPNVPKKRTGRKKGK